MLAAVVRSLRAWLMLAGRLPVRPAMMATRVASASRSPRTWTSLMQSPVHALLLAWPSVRALRAVSMVARASWRLARVLSSLLRAVWAAVQDCPNGLTDLAGRPGVDTDASGLLNGPDGLLEPSSSLPILAKGAFHTAPTYLYPTCLGLLELGLGRFFIENAADH